MEEWRDIKDYEGKYQVSNWGRVRTTRPGFRYKKYHILRGKFDAHGYIVHPLYKEGAYKEKKAHRLVAEAFISNPSNLATVNHKDGDKTNNHIENLEWMSLADNARHSRYVLGNHTINDPNNPLPWCKKVQCCETNQEFFCIAEAAKWVPCNPSCISRALKSGKAVRGYHWRLAS